MYVYLSLLIILFQGNLDAENVYFYKNETAELYSNKSYENFSVNSTYFIIFTKLDLISLRCPICYKVHQINNVFFLKFQTTVYEIQQDANVIVIFRDGNEVLNKTFIIKFEDSQRLKYITFKCSDGYFFPIKDKQLPNCYFRWCHMTACEKRRKENYTTVTKYLKSRNNEYIIDLSFLGKRSHYIIKITLNISRKYPNKLGHTYISQLTQTVTVYRIDRDKYFCNHNNKSGIPWDASIDFNVECRLYPDIPFFRNAVVFNLNRKSQSEWIIKAFVIFNPALYITPKEWVLSHTVTTKVFPKINYVLKKQTLLVYVARIPTGNCNNGSLYMAGTNECVQCDHKVKLYPNFYIKVNYISNQSLNSFRIVNGAICILSEWIPDIITAVEGSIFIKNIRTPVIESERKIGDYRMLIKKSVIKNFEILPNTASINLPDTIKILCQSNGVPLTLYVSVVSVIKESRNNCTFSFLMPAVNKTILIINASIKFEHYWYNTSKIYLIGRIPSIVIITSKYPKLSQNVLCFTDGENSLYEFQWTCRDSNEPKNLISVDYISSKGNNLIFHDTAPLISYKCACLSTYHDTLGRHIFNISADVELNLRSNEIQVCELTSQSTNDIPWTIIVIYILIFFTIPCIFILIAYFVTDGRIKSIIQLKIFSKLGIITHRITRGNVTIPYFIIAKCDVGETKFANFCRKINDVDRTIDVMRLIKQTDFQFTDLKEDIEARENEKLEDMRKDRQIKGTIEYRKRRKSVDEWVSYVKSSSISEIYFPKHQSYSIANRRPRRTYPVRVERTPFLNHKSLTGRISIDRMDADSIKENKTIIRMKSILKEKSASEVGSVENQLFLKHNQ